MIPAHIEHVFKALDRIERREPVDTKDGGISQEYFMARVDKTDSCWLWTGSSDRKGYGKAHFWDGSRRRYRLAHRVSYEMFVAPLEAGKDVCHRCDVPACVNPQHLFLGTRADNVLDCALKDRLPGAKLTIPEVLEIRRELAAGVGYKELARRYRVRAKAIRQIDNREKWKHVSEPQQPMPGIPPALVEGSLPTAGIGTADAGTPEHDQLVIDQYRQAIYAHERLIEKLYDLVRADRYDELHDAVRAEYMKIHGPG